MEGENSPFPTEQIASIIPAHAADLYRQAKSRSMCASKHCSMQTKITDEELVGVRQLLEIIGRAQFADVMLDNVD